MLCACIVCTVSMLMACSVDKLREEEVDDLLHHASRQSPASSSSSPAGRPFWMRPCQHAMPTHVHSNPVLDFLSPWHAND
jgi:hypothetical protein